MQTIQYFDALKVSLRTCYQNLVQEKYQKQEQEQKYHDFQDKKIQK